MAKRKIKALYIDTEDKPGQAIFPELNEELSKAGVDVEDVINIESTDNDWLAVYYKAPA